MSEHGSSSSITQQGGSAQPQQANPAPQPPPFNPLPSHHSQVGSSLGHSVVPDLMKVYESLTHSSTPQVPAPQQSMAAPANVQPTQYSQQQPAAQQQQQQQYQPAQYSQPSHHYVAPQPAQSQQPQYQQQNHYVQPQQQPQYYTRSQDAGPYTQQQGSTSASESYYEPRSQDPPLPEETVTSSGRRSRKRSLDGNGAGDGHSKGRKKGSQSDGRWSKRFTWPEDLHRDFVSAIFDVGLKHSSPSALLEFMPKHDQITSERIKSHLQKYRLHRAKSKKEFMSSYDASLGKFQMGGLDSNVKSLSSGEVASHLTYTTIMGVEEDPAAGQEASNDNSQEGSSSQPPQAGALYLPQLTDAEKQSPIGASMGYLMGLFFSLRQQLMQQREESGNGPGSQGHGNVPSVAQVVTDTGSTNTTVSAVQSSYLPGNVAIGNQQRPHQQAPRTDLTVTWSTHAGQTVDSQQPQHQQAYGAHSDTGSHETPSDGKVVHQGAQQLISPSTRSNVEENNLMKREMQNQMAFQNKMRALKQQELNKYRNVASSGQDAAKDGAADDRKGGTNDSQTPAAAGGDVREAAPGETDNRAQYAGQTAGASGSATKEQGRGTPFGGADDFWNSGDVDDHLFEFLMNT